MSGLTKTKLMAWAVATLSSLLATLLLVLSCSAAACSTTCDLHALAHSVAPMTSHAMAGMEHCSAASTSLSPGADHKKASLTAQPSVCPNHPVCSDLSVFSSRDHRLRMQLLQFHAIATIAFTLAPLIGAPAPVFTTPPLRTPSLASLQTTLRI